MTKSTTDDKQIAVIKKEINPLVTKAADLKIVDVKTMGQSVELLSRCNHLLDQITEEKEKITKPLNEALKEVRTRYAPVESPLKDAITLLRAEQSRYQTAEMARQRAEEAKIAERAKKGTIKLDTAVKKMSEVEKAEEKVVTSAGMVKFREKPAVKIINANKIPREFLVPDEAKILDALKAGNKVEGCELEIISVPVNYR